MKQVANKGFTLLEVMVALAVLSVATTGLMTASSNALRQQQQLEIRIFGTWIAENKLSELRGARVWAEAGTSDERVLLANRQWKLRTVIKETPNPLIRQVDLRVSDDADLAGISLTGFLGRY